MRLFLVLSEVDLRLAELRLNLSVCLLQHEDVMDELVLRPVVVLGLTLRLLGYFLCRGINSWRVLSFSFLVLTALNILGILLVTLTIRFHIYGLIRCVIVRHIGNRSPTDRC